MLILKIIGQLAAGAAGLCLAAFWLSVMRYIFLRNKPEWETPREVEVKVARVVIRVFITAIFILVVVIFLEEILGE